MAADAAAVAVAVTAVAVVAVVVGVGEVPLLAGVAKPLFQFFFSLLLFFSSSFFSARACFHPKTAAAENCGHKVNEKGNKS